MINFNKKTKKKLLFREDSFEKCFRVKNISGLSIVAVGKYLLL